jgi:hypothetical protein
MKPFFCLSLVAFLLASSCTQEEKEPAAKIPAPPPPGQISNNVGNGTPTMTSSTTAARIEVGGSAYEAGAIVYWDYSGCSGVRFQARSFGSPYVVQVSGSTCPGSPTNVTKVVQPTSSWQTYDFSIVQFQGGGLTVMAQANASGSYGGVEVTNIVWY